MIKRNYAVVTLTLLLGACSNVSGPTYNLTELVQPEGIRAFRVSCEGLFSRSETCMNVAKHVCGDSQVRTLSQERVMREGATPRALVFQCAVPQQVQQRPVVAPVVTPRPAEPAPVRKVNLAGDALFETGQAALLPGARQSLNELLSDQGDMVFSRVVIVGHTDSSGSDATNRVLSQRRAQAVASYLRTRGMKYDSIVVEGHGSAEPVATNSTPLGRAKNRRVEIQLEAK